MARKVRLMDEETYQTTRRAIYEIAKQAANLDLPSFLHALAFINGVASSKGHEEFNYEAGQATQPARDEVRKLAESLSEFAELARRLYYAPVKDTVA